MYPFRMEIPDQLQMLSEFTANLLEDSNIQEGYWIYSIQCPAGIEIRVHFHIFYYALTIDILINGKLISTNYQEGCKRIYFDDRSKYATLLGEFIYKNGNARVKLVIEPEPKVEWSTLVTSEL